MILQGNEKESDQDKLGKSTVREAVAQAVFSIYVLA